MNTVAPNKPGSSVPFSYAYVWPRLRPDAWEQTYTTLHRLMQIVGKIRSKELAPIGVGKHNVPRESITEQHLDKTFGVNGVIDSYYRHHQCKGCIRSCGRH